MQLLEPRIMAPLSAGTGRRAVRSFGLKLQQGSNTAAWLQAKPSASFTCSTYLQTRFFSLSFTLVSSLSAPLAGWGTSPQDGWPRWVRTCRRGWRKISLLPSPFLLRNLFPQPSHLRLASRGPSLRFLAPAFAAQLQFWCLGQWRALQTHCVSFISADPD